MMITLTQTQTIAKPIGEVFDFLAHFENRPRFESAVVEATRTSEGDLRAGSEYREVRKSFGFSTTTVYAIEEYEPPHRLGFESVSGPIPVTGTYELDERDGATTVDFTLRMEPRGIMRWFEPLLAAQTRRDLARYYETLKTVLERPS